jgi:hypothetical protein
MTGTAHSYDDDEKWRCDWEKANPNNRRMNCRGNSIQVHGIRMRTSHGSRLGGDDLRNRYQFYIYILPNDMIFFSFYLSIHFLRFK